MASSDAPTARDPYRTAPPKAVRYLCIVCFKTATTDEPGACPCSGAGRLPIDNPEVLDEMRAKVARTRRRRMARWTGIVAVAAGALALAICLAFHLQIAPDPGTLHGTGSWLLLLWLIFASVGAGTVSYLDRAPPPTDAEGMLRWLRVNVSVK